TDAQPYSGPGAFYPWFYSFQICGENITSPLIMRWDTSLFNAPFLPEPVFGAGLTGEYFFWHIDPYTPPFPPDFMIPDQVRWLTGRDSMIFFGVENDPPFPMTLIMGDNTNDQGITESTSTGMALTFNGSTLLLELKRPMAEVLIQEASGRLCGIYQGPSDRFNISIADLSVGFYIVTARSPSGDRMVGKFIKQ